MMRMVVGALAFGWALLAIGVSSPTPAQAGYNKSGSVRAVASRGPGSRVVVHAPRRYYGGPRRHYVGAYRHPSAYYGPDITDGYYNPGYTQAGYYADPGMYADGNYYDGGYYNGRDAGYGGNYLFRR
jgi:hypothetical protein